MGMLDWGILFIRAMEIKKRYNIQEPTTEQLEKYSSKQLSRFIAQQTVRFENKDYARFLEREG